MYLMLKLPVLQNLVKILTLKFDLAMTNQLSFKKCLNSSIKQIGELTEPYGANNADLFDIENPEKFIQGYHAACFSCINLELSPETS